MELQLVHFSVQQYLKSDKINAAFLDKRTGVDMMLQTEFTEIRARGCMTRICLAYLSQFREKLPARKVRVDFPLVHYSAEYWIDHARPAEREDSVQEMILNFFLEKRNSYAIWGTLFDPDYPWKAASSRYNKMPPALYYATLAGLQNTVEAMLDKGAGVNTKGGRYGNALQAASENGDIEIVQLLRMAAAS